MWNHVDHGSDVSEQSVSAPDLSVVVIGRNEGQRLLRCLDSIAALKNPSVVEVIYVDSASSDGSPETAMSKGARVIRVTEGKMSAARARNLGWRVAQAALVLFLDGDTILHPNFLSTAVPYFDDRQIAIISGHLREIRPLASVYNRVLGLDWIVKPGFTTKCGGNALMRKSALEEAGGFNDSLIAGEEPEMCQRLMAVGYTIRHIDHPMALHDLAITAF